MISHLLGHDIPMLIFTVVNGMQDSLRLASQAARILKGKG